MAEISHFSLAYDSNEDRLAWDAEDAEGVVTRLWLTQRLCRNFLNALLPMLEGRTAAADAPDPAAPARQSQVQAWEQAAAMADFGKLPAVRVTPQAAAGLVRTIHIAPTADVLTLTFAFGLEEERKIGLGPAAVRQMLAQMHRLHQAAVWPVDAFPAWLSEAPVIPADTTVN